MYVILNEQGQAINVAETFESIGSNTKYTTPTEWGEQEATVYAEQLSSTLKRPYIAVQTAYGHRRKFDIIAAPQVGDKVSYTFNGECYPCGEIVRISPTLKKIITNHDKVFYRRGNTGQWMMHNTWSMIPGHHFKQTQF